MPTVDSAQFLKSIKSPQAIPSLLLLIGEEATLLEDCFKSFENAFFSRYGQEFLEFNYESLNGTTNGADAIIESCSTLPFGAQKKLVVVHHVEKLPDAFKKSIAEYLQNPNPSTSVVFFWNDRPNATNLNHALTEAVTQVGSVVKCWKPYKDRRPEWIQQELSKYSKKISIQGAMLLSEEGGESLAELKSEIEKLVLYVGKKSSIEVHEVRQTMSFKRGESIWDLTDALEKGQMKEAGTVLKNCLAQGEEPLLLLNLIARSVRKNREILGEKKSASATHQMKKLDHLLKSGHGAESAAFERLIQSL